MKLGAGGAEGGEGSQQPGQAGGRAGRAERAAGAPRGVVGVLRQTSEGMPCDPGLPEGCSPAISLSSVCLLFPRTPELVRSKCDDDDDNDDHNDNADDGVITFLRHIL